MTIDSSTTKIRPGTVEDYKKIASVHVTAVREAYEDILSKAVLDSFSLELREATWRHALERVPPMSVFVAETAANELVGFAAGDLRQSDMLQRDAEIGAIYLLKKAQRQGIGRRMMTALVRMLQEQGANSVYLWVLRENEAMRQFCERHAGREISERTETEADQQLVEISYGWDDLDRLLKSLAEN